MKLAVNRYAGFLALSVLTTAVLLAAPLSSKALTPFADVVSFGDSLSDSGNIFEVSNGLIPPAPYFNGRFSNGPVWVEIMAQELGLGPLVPSEAGGLNYAVGGAQTEDDDGGSSDIFLPDDVPQQVIAYLNSHTPDGNELFVVEGGANDLLSGGQTDVTIPVGNLVGFITDLYNAGGRSFIVPNLPPLGKIPSRVGGPDQMTLDTRALQFNGLLSTELDNLEAILTDITIFRVDFFAMIEQVMTTPGAFGFINVTDPAFDENSNTVVPNPDAYLFFDEIHPTAAGHRILGELASLSVVPEPAALTMLVMAAVGLAARRRR